MAGYYSCRSAVYLATLFLWNLQIAVKANLQPDPIQDSANGIWALSTRTYSIFLTNRDVTETTKWIETYADTDVAFDPISGLAFYCIMGPSNECMLHRTSFDKCFDEELLELDMQLVYGMVIDSATRFLYLAAFNVPRIYRINIDTGQYDVLFEVVDENIQFLTLSRDKRNLYWISHDFVTDNFVRRGNVDGSGTPINLFSRPLQITAFGIDNTANRFYFNQDLTVYSTDLNGNDERMIFTETEIIREITMVGGYVYWGNELGNFRRVSLSGTPANNQIETLATLSLNDALINQRLVTPQEIDMARSILSFASSTFIAYENEQQLTIEVIRTRNLLRCSCVDVDITTGSRRIARAAIQNTLNFGAGEQSKSFTITWTDDDIPDAIDVVTAQLSVVSDDSIGAITTADIVIRDDDCGYFFSDDAVFVNENTGLVDVFITRTCTGDSLAQTIVVEASEINGSAKAGMDFIAGPVEAHFASGTDTAIARILIGNDNEPEDSESFTLELVMPENGRLNEPNTATVTILDYDNVYMLNDNTYEVLESVGVLNFIVRRFGNTDIPGSIRIAARAQDAKFPDDFAVDPSFEVVSFPTGIAQQPAQITITDDDILEANETFEVFLHSPVNGSIDSRNKAIVSITDNEAEVALIDSHFSCFESHECFVEVIRRGYLGDRTTARIITEDLSAFAGSDFIAVDYISTFDPWDTNSDRIQVTLINDEVKEPHTNFIIVVNDVTGGTVGSPGRANVALWDDDSELPTLVYSLDRISYNIKESQERLQIVILRNESYLGQTGSVRIQAVTTATSTAEEVADFSNPYMVVEFSEGQSRQTIDVAITNDDVIEGSETFTVELLDAVNGVLGDIRMAVVTVVDDDALYYFDTSTYRVSEASDKLEIAVNRDGFLLETGRVILQVRGGSARIGADYKYPPQGKNLEFLPGQTTMSATIEVIDDNVVETEESIELALSGAQYGSLGNPAFAEVFIEDNDVVIDSSTVSPPSSGKQLGSLSVTLIIIGIAVLVTVMLLLLCCICAVVIYRRRPEEAWPLVIPPQRQFEASQPPYSKSFYTERKNPLGTPGKNNPLFEDLYGLPRTHYADNYRPGFARQLALPPGPSGYP